jgi:hypothetical protein
MSASASGISPTSSLATSVHHSCICSRFVSVCAAANSHLSQNCEIPPVNGEFFIYRDSTQGSFGEIVSEGQRSSAGSTPGSGASASTSHPDEAGPGARRREPWRKRQGGGDGTKQAMSMRWGARTPDRGALDRDRGAIRNTGPKEYPSGLPAVRSELRPWVMDGLGKGAGRPKGRPTGSGNG